MNCGIERNTAIIRSYDGKIPNSIKNLPECSFYKFLYMNPNSTRREKLSAIKKYINCNDNPNRIQ